MVTRKFCQTSKCLKIFSFDTINIFPNIDHNVGLSSVKKYLDLCSKSIPPTNFYWKLLKYAIHVRIQFLIMKAIEDSAQGPHILFCYTDIAMTDFDKEALEHRLSPTTWKRFSDDIFVL